jgi:tyrosine-protein phosphatase YwqE
MKNKYSLTVKQATYLLSVIFIAIVFKVITSKDIEYYDNKIQNIDGIEFTQKNIIIKREIYDIEVGFSPEIFLDKKLMADNWEKYLTTLRKCRKS